MYKTYDRKQLTHTTFKKKKTLNRRVKRDNKCLLINTSDTNSLIRKYIAQGQRTNSLGIEYQYFYKRT